MADRAQNENPNQIRKEFRVDGLPTPLSHYADAVTYGNFAFISGCVPLQADGRVVGVEIAEQARQTLGNLQRVLRAVGAEFEDVLKVTVYLTNIGDRVELNAVRREFFGDSRPASTLVEVSALALPEIMVEIEAVASIPVQTQREESD